MLRRSPGRVAGLAATLALLAPGLGRAEDVKGKFYVSGNLGVLVTTDNIRNNAALIIAPLGNDGAPFTGDKGEVVSCDVGRSDVFCDPRPDDLIARQTTLEQTYKLDATVGYGLASRFSVQLDVGYYKGEIRNLDTYTTTHVPFGTAQDVCIQAGAELPCDLSNNRVLDFRQPITAGRVTEIPVGLTGILRFRKDSNFNPYLGAGVGYLFTSLDRDQAVDDLNTRLSELRIRSITDEFGPSFGRRLAMSADGNAPFQHPVEVTIEEGFQWQVVGGAEYFFNDRLSVLFDARYVLADHAVEISMGGEDQINISSFSESLFRPDGSLRVFNSAGQAPNPIDPNSSVVGGRYSCNRSTNPPPQDYDADGHTDDACFQPGPMVSGDITQTVVVQGGRIRLTNFAFAVGLRWHF